MHRAQVSLELTTGPPFALPHEVGKTPNRRSCTETEWSLRACVSGS